LFDFLSLGEIMSEVFENDIDFKSDDLSFLEDPIYEDYSNKECENYVFPEPLYKTKLEYSSEAVYTIAPNDMNLEAGDYVIIPTRYGKDIALIMGIATKPIGICPDDVVTVERKATSQDLEKAADLRNKEESAFKIFQEKAAAHHLEMKLIATHYLLEEQKILFFFSAENRVDFRELVKDLVSVFKMRIELRQIGVRDESRITGGLGICGRPYCCHAVSDRLKPVSIRMAKDQNLSLNSMKISGQCGRLLCCLSYEYDWYVEARRKMPNEGIRFFYDGTSFRVIETNSLTAMVKMIGDDGRILEMPVSRMKLIDGRWKIIN
jgi:cell fate regulator YaaT (PSP1 superfamily)